MTGAVPDLAVQVVHGVLDFATFGFGAAGEDRFLRCVVSAADGFAGAFNPVVPGTVFVEGLYVSSRHATPHAGRSPTATARPLYRCAAAPAVAGAETQSATW